MSPKIELSIPKKKTTLFEWFFILLGCALLISSFLIWHKASQWKAPVAQNVWDFTEISKVELEYFSGTPTEPYGVIQYPAGYKFWLG